MLRILIADDHPLIRKGLTQILADSVYVGRVDEASSGAETMEHLRNAAFDLVILDISMPGKDGLDVLKDIKTLYPKLPVIMLSIQQERQYAVRAFKAGASACLSKAGAPEELLEAIKQVAAGHSYISKAVGEALLEDVTGSQEGLPHRHLSDREYQVFLLLASGKTLTEISEQLSLSVKTVSTYRARLLEKMGMQNNSQLTHYAFQYRLIQ